MSPSPAWGLQWLTWFLIVFCLDLSNLTLSIHSLLFSSQFKWSLDQISGCRFLDLFFCISSFSLVVCPTTASHLSYLKLWFLVPKFSETSILVKSFHVVILKMTPYGKPGVVVPTHLSFYQRSQYSATFFFFHSIVPLLF